MMVIIWCEIWNGVIEQLELVVVLRGLMLLVNRGCHKILVETNSQKQVKGHRYMMKYSHFNSLFYKKKEEDIKMRTKSMININRRHTTCSYIVRLNFIKN